MKHGNRLFGVNFQPKRHDRSVTLKAYISPLEEFLSMFSGLFFPLEHIVSVEYCSHNLVCGSDCNNFVMIFPIALPFGEHITVMLLCERHTVTRRIGKGRENRYLIHYKSLSNHFAINFIWKNHKENMITFKQFCD